MTLLAICFGVVAALLIGACLPIFAERIVSYKCRQLSLDKPLLSKSFQLKAALLCAMISAAGFVGSFRVADHVYLSLELLCIVFLSCVFAYIDLRIRIIPNELVLLFLSVCVVFRLLEWSVSSLLNHVGGFALVLIIFVLAALLTGKGSVGAGDVKLAMVIGFAAGYPYALYAILAMALSMGLYGIAGMLLKKLTAKSKLPFAAFLMFGAIVAKLVELVSFI